MRPIGYWSFSIFYLTEGDHTLKQKMIDSQSSVANAFADLAQKISFFLSFVILRVLRGESFKTHCGHDNPPKTVLVVGIGVSRSIQSQNQEL